MSSANRSIRIMCAGVAIAIPLSTFAAPLPLLIEWSRQIGSELDDEARSIAVDTLGNTFITGSTDGDLAGPHEGDEENGFLAKFDTLGGLVWANQFVSEYVEPSSIATDRLGNIYVTGDVTGELGGSAYGRVDAFISKFDASGNSLWTQRFGTELSDRSSSIAIGAAGDIFVAGHTHGQLGETNAGDVDGFVARFDPNGNRLWTQQFGSSDMDFSTSLVLDAMDNIYVTGNTFGNSSASNAGSFDGFLLKFDASGNSLWYRQFGTSEPDASRAVIADQFGGVYVAGSTTGALHGTNSGADDAFLIKFDQFGEQVWSRQFGALGRDSVDSISVDDKGNIYATGFSDADIAGPNLGQNDAFLVKIDTRGSLEWKQQFGTKEGDIGTAVITDARGNVLVTGVTDGALAAANRGLGDVFLIKFSIPEPSSLTLLILALIAFRWRLRSYS